MAWNWQQPEWPDFTWSAGRLTEAERQFLVRGGVLLGTVRHLDDDTRERLTIASMSEEAVTSSEIEGEMLSRDSVQSSIRRQFGLQVDAPEASAAERGIAEMMVTLFRTHAAPLDEASLCSWHDMLMLGRRDLRQVGHFRTHDEPMQVISGKIHDPTVHFEAPPSRHVAMEMRAFLEWFNATTPGEPDSLPPLTRSGLAHLYFESIHPFEDGNGRLGRAISEKALAQGLGVPSLTALAATILARKRDYYDMLEVSNKALDVNDWLTWFAGVALEAQQRAHARVEFLIDKAKLLDAVRDDLNERQLKVLQRVLAEGPEGFRGGLSAGNYISIAKTSPATARRDLAGLVDKHVFARTGERRYARYHLTIPLRPVSAVSIDGDGNVVEVERRT